MQIIQANNAKLDNSRPYKQSKPFNVATLNHESLPLHLTENDCEAIYKTLRETCLACPHQKNSWCIHALYAELMGDLTTKPGKQVVNIYACISAARITMENLMAYYRCACSNPLPLESGPAPACPPGTPGQLGFADSPGLDSPAPPHIGVPHQSAVRQAIFCPVDTATILTSHCDARVDKKE